MKTWALIKDGFVINTFLWDGMGKYQHDDNAFVVEYDESNIAGPGFYYDGQFFFRPSLNEEQQGVSEEQISESVNLMKKLLMDEASQKISTLQDAVDLEMATEGENILVTAWKRYRVLLNRVDTTALSIDWPKKP